MQRRVFHDRPRANNRIYVKLLKRASRAIGLKYSAYIFVTGSRARVNSDARIKAENENRIRAGERRPRNNARN